MPLYLLVCWYPSLVVYLLHSFIKIVFFSVKNVQILILLFSIDIIKFRIVRLIEELDLYLFWTAGASFD